VPRRAPDAADERHHSRYYLRLVERLGLMSETAAGAPVASLAVEPRLRSAASQLLQSRGVPAGAALVGLAPGAAYGQAKRWLPEHVAALARELAADGVTSVMVGASADAETGRAIESALGAPGDGPALPGLVSLIGRTDLPTLAAVLALCRAVVSNDSGAMHVAAAVGTPVVAVFGPTDERATAPLGEHTIVSADVFCRPCHLRSCPIDHRCMRRVTPTHVHEAVRRHLAAERRS
jgi:heptosyltransferase-2